MTETREAVRKVRDEGRDDEAEEAEVGRYRISTR